MMNIGIVGLGLIGGSMAKSLNARTNHRILGYDLNKEISSIARQCGAIDEFLTRENMNSCSIILIAIPPSAVATWVCDCAPFLSTSAIVIDMCGVKQVLAVKIGSIAREYGFVYVGGHPMAGKEQNGFAASTENLFVGASMILTPEKGTPLPEGLEAFFLSVGFARVLLCSPGEHDRIIAYTSHLGHIISNAYVKSPELRRCVGFTAGSFRDMTRIACMDEALWTELFFANAHFLTIELRNLIENFEKYADALQSQEPERMSALLREGRNLFSEFH